MLTHNYILIFIGEIVIFCCFFLPNTLLAHHGWGWATAEEFEITGEIVDVRLGNPHGEVDLLVDDSIWTVEVGQPWRNEKAGLTDKLIKGMVLKVHGHRSANESVRLVKAERIVIDGKDYNLYPNRES